MSVINSIPLIAAGDDGYQISRSVRLRSSASAYLNRTPASASNRNTWTWSAWVKRGILGSGQTVFAAYPSSTVYAYIGFTSSDQIRYSSTNSGASLTTTAVYRDPSAWYHIVFVYDDTQATSSNRLKLYVNGVQVTAFGTASYPTLNFGDYINSANVHNLGRFPSGTEYTDGYLTEINFIDGQALTPSSFGETDTITGVWKPKKYAGTYGTNGFYLNFSDNSAATAAAIGKDSSGNGNNWTPNNISVTSGVTYDSMLDVPTPYADGGNGRGNYCVINPLDTQNASSVAQGNQYISFSAVNYGHSRATMSIPDSSYWEVIAGGSAYLTLGVANSTAFSSWNWSGSWAIYQSDGKVYNSAAAITGVLATFTTNDVIGFAVKGNKLYIAKNGTWLNSGDPVAGTGSVASSLPSEIFPYIGNGGGAAGTPSAYFNAGQRPFAYTPPTGFKALNTQNLPDATIKKGNAYFDVSTYTGTGSALSVTNSGAMQPDLVWLKRRSTAATHVLVDSVRGVSAVLNSNLTNAESTASAGTGLTAFNSNGFSLGTENSATGSTNVSTETYAAWQWKESASAGFDIVTGTTPASYTSYSVAHSLGVTPAMIIYKERSGTANWWVWHKSFSSASNALQLNTTAAIQAGAYFGTQTSSVAAFQAGIQTGLSVGYVAYLFAEVAGFSKFGSYTGNASSDGPFVYCGFRPRFILLKNASAAYNWTIWDTTRNTYNVLGEYLVPNTSDAAATNTSIDVLANGFKIRDPNIFDNGSGNTIIYAAFAENPFKNSLAR